MPEKRRKRNQKTADITPDMTFNLDSVDFIKGWEHEQLSHWSRKLLLKDETTVTDATLS